MILKSLYLKNYRTYRGPETIYFATGNENVTIIQGNNEVGKTTIMNAITWCLYGVEFYKQEGNEPIWSKSTSYDLNNGDEDIVEVVLTMVDPKDKIVKFKRTLEFYKNDSGECRPGASKDEILVDEVPVNYKQNFISKRLPKNFRRYFLFDGEELVKYFEGNNSHIKESVYKLSHLNLLDNIKKHLRNREKDFIEELGELNPSYSHALKKQMEIEENLSDKNKEYDEIIKNLDDWKKEKKEKHLEIKKCGEGVETLIDDKEKFEEEIEKIDEEIEKKENEYTLFLTNNFSKVFSINYLLNVKSICKELEEKGYIPSKYKKEFLKYLIDTHECICGADLSEGSDAHKKMVELYNNTPDTTDISDEVNVLLGGVNNIIHNFPTEFDDELKEHNRKLVELGESRREYALQIEDIDNLLGTDTEKRVRQLQESVSQLEALIDINGERKGEIKEQIKILNSKLEEAKKEVAKEKSKLGEKTDLETSKEFCNTVYTIVDNIYKELENEIHLKLQDLTSEEFNKMHWKEFYNGVSIDDDYNVTIHKENGDIVPNDLSKGGQLVLALSFMTALNSLSGFELPIIIDTPLGRLDEPIKEKIAENLPIYTRNKQVTLLVTSSEYSEGFKKGIRNYVGAEYQLKYIQEKDGITTIDEIKRGGARE